MLEICKEHCTPTVSISSLNFLWKTYLEWGELPYIVRKTKDKLKAKMNLMGERAIIDNNEMQVLKQIEDENPNLYLDEISLQFGIITR